MPARIIRNSQGGIRSASNEKIKAGAPIQVKAPNMQENKGEKINIAPAAPVNVAFTQENIVKEEISSQKIHKNSAKVERAQFYTGSERLNLQGTQVQRIRELQEENDHLQREIATKEMQITDASDPLAILADIEHRKIIVARNTGEILKIYLKNEERIKRINELENENVRVQAEMMKIQGQFVSTKDMEEKTKIASEFFIMKSEIERNMQEINELNKN